MQGDVLRLVTFDFILGAAGAGVVSISFEFHILEMHPDDGAGDASGFRVPSDMISNCKFTKLRLFHWT